MRATVFRPRSAEQPHGNPALSYARQRAGYAPTEIQMLDNDWNIAETVSQEVVRALI
jgi:hypothetical protein